MIKKPVLVTGATGYVGGRLVPKLLEAGYRVRAAGRSLDKLASRPWAGHPLLELARVDLLDRPSLDEALAGCGPVFYLVHSMNPANMDFAEADRRSAHNMAAAAERARVDRMIYLGGVIPHDPNISEHLLSRAEVGQILKKSTVPLTWLRAAMIMGSGSVSFEIMRYLVNRMPLMITPSWVRTLVQPISIRNVLNYLVGCLEKEEETSGQTFDICGPDVVTYEELFQMYAQEAGLTRRIILPVPILSPKLSAYWIHMVTPVHSSIARPLAEGLRNKAVCAENSIKKIIPQELLDCRNAIRRILEKRKLRIVETDWTDAGALTPPEWVHSGDVHYAGGDLFEEQFSLLIRASQEEVWDQVTRLGGDTGWYHGDWLWRVRGAMDKMVGGVGLRRGRRHPVHLQSGDALDFWRVLEAVPPRRLNLLAEMKLPGEATLEFRVQRLGGELSRLRMITKYLPRGLPGLLYWYAVKPLHFYVFKGLLRGLAQAVGRPVVSGPARDPKQD